MNDATERYPLDAEKINKGDIIDEVTCRAIIDALPDTQKFRLGLLNLSEWIEKETRKVPKNIGAPIHSRIEGNTIRLLTDEESREERERQFANAVKKMGREFRRTAEIDRANLSADSLQKLDDSLARKGWMLQRMRKAAREKLPEPNAPKQIEGPAQEN